MPNWSMNEIKILPKEHRSTPIDTANYKPGTILVRPDNNPPIAAIMVTNNGYVNLDSGNYYLHKVLDCDLQPLEDGQQIIITQRR